MDRGPGIATIHQERPRSFPKRIHSLLPATHGTTLCYLGLIPTDADRPALGPGKIWSVSICESFTIKPFGGIAGLPVKLCRPSSAHLHRLGIQTTTKTKKQSDKSVDDTGIKTNPWAFKSPSFNLKHRKLNINPLQKNWEWGLDFQKDTIQEKKIQTWRRKIKERLQYIQKLPACNFRASPSTSSRSYKVKSMF